MRNHQFTAAALAAGIFLAGCGDDKKDTAKPKAPAPAELVVTVTKKGVTTSADAVPAKRVVRVDYKVSSRKKTTIQINNNGTVVSEVAVGRDDQFHVLLQPLFEGELGVTAGKRTKVIKVTPAS
jgi:hypothetical protein